MRPAVLYRVANCGCIRLAIPQTTEWQRIGNEIDSAMTFARAYFINAHRVVVLFSQPGEWQKLISLFFSREEKQLLFRAGNFCKAKDKESGAGKRSSRYQSHQGGKYATPDSTRCHVDDGPLRADHRRLFILCWAAWASDVLITPAPT